MILLTSVFFINYKKISNYKLIFWSFKKFELGNNLNKFMKILINSEKKWKSFFENGMLLKLRKD